MKTFATGASALMVRCSATAAPGRRARFGLAGALALAFASASLVPLRSVAAETPEQELRRQLDENRALIQQLQERMQSMEQALQKAEQTARATVAQAKRLDETEEQILALDERLGSRPVARVFDGKSLDLGGFLTQQFTFAHGKDKSAGAFNATQFELLMRAQVTEQVSVFSALGFLWESDLNVLGPVPVNPRAAEFAPFAARTMAILASANYRHTDALQFEAGRFVTPHGIINIEHFPPTLLDVNQPQFLRPFGGQTIFPNFLNGARAHGKVFKAGGQFDYSAYAGVSSTSSANRPQAENYGARLAFRHDPAGLSFGVNFAHGRRPAAPATPVSFAHPGHAYDLFGVDLLLDKGRWLWKNELFATREQNGVPDRLGFYTQPAFRFSDKFIGFYRFDYLDAGFDPFGRTIEHALGVNYLLTPFVRLRAVGIAKDYKRPNTTSEIIQFSTTVSF